jgi:hypothetical protein
MVRSARVLDDGLAFGNFAKRIKSISGIVLAYFFS